MKAPNILLIYTGGTIGMVKDSSTSALRPFNFDNLIKRIPEINLLDCTIDTISFDTPIDSSNINPDNWVSIAEIIESNYNIYNGFVVLHGSDTMSYSASALSFMFENLNKPVIFTGSQLPIGDLRTDAKENLITSIQVAALTKNNEPIIKEVCLYFEYKLFRGNRTTKVNAEHFKAFDSLNFPKLIESGVNLELFENNILSGSTLPLKVHKGFCKDVLILKLFPGIQEHILRQLLSVNDLKGIVIETYGAGNTLTEPWFTDILEKVIAKGVKVVNVTQCLKGSVKMNLYETGIHLKKAGVISAKDMTIEAAITKMMFLLSDQSKYTDFKKSYETPLRGEIS